MILVTYNIKAYNSYGEYEYQEYSWFSMGSEADYNMGVIKDKVLIKEVYGDEEEEIFEDNYDDDTNIFDYYTGDISVYSVQNITIEELDVLDKLGIINR